MSQWTTPYNLLADEFQQRADEGCVIPASLRQRFAELHCVNDAWNESVIDRLYDDLMTLEPDHALASCEPNDLAAIRALRPAGPRDLAWRPSEAELIDRLHGAWLGRAAGCALGKPVEGMGMWMADGRPDGRRRIKTYLTNRAAWPLQDFFAQSDAGDGLTLSCPRSCRAEIAYMEPDDDIHYTLVGLGVLEEFGPGFDWHQVAWYWTSHIPFAAICTAETQAVFNYWQRSSRHSASGWGVSGPDAARGQNLAATPAFTRRHRNPYREWIGAQIRSDGWAMACAGKPELAAEFAYRDACWTHERNGIYGEMFCAAIQAAAFVERDPVRLVEIGLSEIPRDCRLARVVRETLAWASAEHDWERVMERIDARCAELSGGRPMSAVHTINNAAICVLALVHGRGSPALGIPLSVMAGYDTDCNGATVGTVLGAGTGKAAFDWAPAARLNDTIRPSMIDFQEVTMADLARRHAVQWQRVDDWQRKRPGI
jgi:ADP-ribosylglycohydrolase